MKARSKWEQSLSYTTQQQIFFKKYSWIIIVHQHIIYYQINHIIFCKHLHFYTCKCFILMKACYQSFIKRSVYMINTIRSLHPWFRSQLFIPCGWTMKNDKMAQVQRRKASSLNKWIISMTLGGRHTYCCHLFTVYYCSSYLCVNI